MRTQTIEYKDDVLDVKVTVSEATILIGMKRTLLQAEAPEEEDDARRLLRLRSYPDLMAATVETEGFDSWPPSFEDFILLPDKLLYPWEQAIYKLNPHWINLGSAEEVEELVKKKVPTSTDDSKKK